MCMVPVSVGLRTPFLSNLIMMMLMALNIDKTLSKCSKQINGLFGMISKSLKTCSDVTESNLSTWKIILNKSCCFVTTCLKRRPCSLLSLFLNFYI